MTTATRLFNEKVDEQLVMERTGHRSTAVRAYKRTSAKLQQEISNILQPPMPKQDVKASEPEVTETVKNPAAETSKCSPPKKRLLIKYCSENGETVEISL